MVLLLHQLVDPVVLARTAGQFRDASSQQLHHRAGLVGRDHHHTYVLPVILIQGSPGSVLEISPYDIAGRLYHRYTYVLFGGLRGYTVVKCETFFS